VVSLDFFNLLFVGQLEVPVILYVHDEAHSVSANLDSEAAGNFIDFSLVDSLIALLFFVFLYSARGSPIEHTSLHQFVCIGHTSFHQFERDKSLVGAPPTLISVSTF